ncbi:MAG TPA: transcriptional regulator [Flavobacteriales bacterium]|nr:transcriptional regulator [Flavobacteriales bacterium]
MFSKACEYGIKATLFIAHRSEKNQRVSLKSITEAINSPEAFTAKILQKLARNKIVHSSKGPGGGFRIEKDEIDQITLSDIVIAIDGDQIYTSCGLGMEECSEEAPCPAHEKFKPIKESLRITLESTNLKELMEDINKGLTFLK